MTLEGEVMGFEQFKVDYVHPGDKSFSHWYGVVLAVTAVRRAVAVALRTYSKYAYGYDTSTPRMDEDFRSSLHTT